MSQKVKLTNVRLAFPNLFQPDQYGRYGATFILPHDSASYKAMKSALKAVAEADLKGKMPSPSNLCLKDSTEKADYAGFEEGTSYVAASRKEGFKPNQIINRDKTPCESESVMYPGCYVNAVVNVWAQDNNYGRKLNAELVGVQFFKDGERLGRGSTSIDEDDFDALPELEGADEAESADAFF